MKIIPKFQLGGGIASMFTLYTPIQTILPAAKSDDSDISKLAKAVNKEDDTKGRLTEKDLFSMLKDIDGLPNEMRSIVTNLENTFMTEKLLGLSTSDLASTYLRNLYLVKVASANKTKYDEAYKVALENGSLNEPAIAGNGQLVYQTLDGLIDYVDIGEYLNNPDAYPILSVSLLANIRAYDPRFNGNLDIFNTMQNSVGFESFLKILDQAKALLGSSVSVTQDSGFLRTGLKILDYINGLTPEQRLKTLQALSGEPTYTLTLEEKSNVNQIGKLVSYLVSVLPERAKTWAAWKTRNPDKNKAAWNLVSLYLLGGEESSSSVKLEYDLGSTSKSGLSGDGSNIEDIKLNTPAMWLAGYGPIENTIINPGTKLAIAISSNSLPFTDSLNKPIGGLTTLIDVQKGNWSGIFDWTNVTMGGNKISPNMFNRIILSDGLAHSVDFPCKVDENTGDVVPILDANIVRSKLAADKEIKLLGIDLSKPDLIKQNYLKINAIYEKYKLPAAYNSEGKPVGQWRRFAVVDATASNKSLGLDYDDVGGLLQSVNDDNTIENLNTLTKEDIKGHSSFWGGDTYFKGTLWIPVKVDYNAALGSLKASEALKIYEELYINEINSYNKPVQP